MNNVNDIKKSHLCYGCGTCNVVCAHGAITMQYDNIGRLLPVIDNQKCTDCGLCRNICPSLDLKGIQLPDTKDKYIGHVENVYIGKATDERIYRSSQSGGLVTATIKFLFETGKIDAAIMCRVEDAIEYTPKAVVITSPDELYSCQKSSYVPIDIVSALKQATSYTSIAVVGTGCHIQGVKALQDSNKKYREKIKYKLGLICDRTLCKTVTNVLYSGRYKDEAKRIVWRDKSLNYKNARLMIQTADKKKEIPRWQRFVLKDPFTNPRCRICFDKLNTGADIVFGDPWGMKNVDWQEGMSVVISRTEKGVEVITNLLNGNIANLQEAPLNEVLTGQKIENRKVSVSSSLAYYQHKGWLMPSYSEHLFPSNENPKLTNLIDTFVCNSIMSKEKIIKKNSEYLRNIRIKSFIKSVLKSPFRFLRK